MSSSLSSLLTKLDLEGKFKKQNQNKQTEKKLDAFQNYKKN